MMEYIKKFGKELIIGYVCLNVTTGHVAQLVRAKVL